MARGEDEVSGQDPDQQVALPDAEKLGGTGHYSYQDANPDLGRVSPGRSWRLRQHEAREERCCLNERCMEWLCHPPRVNQRVDGEQGKVQAGERQDQWNSPT